MGAPVSRLRPLPAGVTFLEVGRVVRNTNLRTSMLSRVGKYEIVGEIGHGGMATVYEARDTRLDRLVALKVMHPHLQGAKEARARFAREAVTIARLRHPNILEIYDYSGEESDTSYIAAELLTGPTLKQLVEQHADIPAEVASCMTILLARALGAAHTEGVIHRDVKPENVLLHENRAIKLTDFGIAQLIDMQGMTTTGQVLGSPGHMAPEQIEGRECDIRSDLFSLGTVLYLLSTGELPFQGKNPHQVLKNIVDGHYRDPLQVKPQMGGRLRAIIMKCLETDPNARYSTAKELENDLESFVRGSGIEDPGEFIADYLRGTGAFTAQFRERIIAAEAALGERAMKAGDMPRAMDAFNRVLSYDERNERVLNAVKKLGRRSQLRRIAVWGGIATLLVGGVGLVVSALAAKPEASEQQAVTKPTLPIEEKEKPAPSVPVNAVSEPDSPRQNNHRPSESKRPARSVTPPLVKPDEPPVDPKQPRHVILRPEPANVSIGVDGQTPRDFGPSFRELDLLPGTHVFRIKGAHDCCVDEEFRVDIAPGNAPFFLSHRLRFRPAGLYVVSNTPANVVVGNGLASGRTRSVIQVQQPDDMYANHVVRITGEGHDPLAGGPSRDHRSDVEADCAERKPDSNTLTARRELTRISVVVVYNPRMVLRCGVRVRRLLSASLLSLGLSVVLGLPSSAAPCWVSRAHANDFEDFENARSAYEAQDYAKAATLFDALAGGDVPQLTNRSLVLESKKYLGASYLFLGKISQAEQEFTRLLRMDPGYLLDPLAFPEEVQRLFARVKLQLDTDRRASEEERKREEQRIVREQTEHSDKERARWAELSNLAQVETVHEVRSRWLALVPFGAGQFQNGQTSLGAVLAVSEGSLLALSIVTYVLHDHLRGQMPTPNEIADARLAEQGFRYTNQISFALFAILAVTGVIDAQIRFLPTHDYERKRPLPPELSNGPEVSFDLTGTGASFRLRY
jgi:hypothetical protein